MIFDGNDGQDECDQVENDRHALHNVVHAAADDHLAMIIRNAEGTDIEREAQGDLQPNESWHRRLHEPRDERAEYRAQAPGQQHKQRVRLRPLSSKTS